MNLGEIKRNVHEILKELPFGTKLVAAAKSRRPEEVLAAIEAGVETIGENYVQEAEAAYSLVADKARWHFIGCLQKNKVKKAVAIFDMLETVDSLALAKEIDRHCTGIDKVMPVLIEVNSGREVQKSGVMSEDAEALIKEIACLKNLSVQGLMTIGPYATDPEEARPCFRKTRLLFGRIRELCLPGVEMRYLSMGMSDSYRVAIEEGANIVRLGSRIFGPRF